MHLYLYLIVHTEQTEEYEPCSACITFAIDQSSQLQITESNRIQMIATVTGRCLG